MPRRPQMMPAQEGAEAARTALRQAIVAAGGQVRFATQHGVPVADVSNGLRTDRGLTARVMAAVGWEKVIVFRRKSGANLGASAFGP